MANIQKKFKDTCGNNHLKILPYFYIKKSLNSINFAQIDNNHQGIMTNVTC